MISGGWTTLRVLSQRTRTLKNIGFQRCLKKSTSLEICATRVQCGSNVFAGHLRISKYTVCGAEKMKESLGVLFRFLTLGKRSEENDFQTVLTVARVLVNLA